MADGSVGALTYSTLGSKTSGGERVEVFGGGFGVGSEDFRRVTIQKAIRRTSRRWFPAKGYDAQMRSFFDALRDGRQAAVTVLDGARSTIGCLRLLDAARTQSTVAIDMGSALGDHGGEA